MLSVVIWIVCSWRPAVRNTILTQIPLTQFDGLYSSVVCTTVNCISMQYITISVANLLQITNCSKNQIQIRRISFPELLCNFYILASTYFVIIKCCKALLSCSRDSEMFREKCSKTWTATSQTYTDGKVQSSLDESLVSRCTEWTENSYTLFLQVGRPV